MQRASSAVALFSSLFVAAPVGAAQTEAPARGFALWVRAPGRSIQDLASSAVGAPQFVIGVRRGRLSAGLGLGLSLVRTSDKDTVQGRTLDDKVRATAFQFGPSVLIDISHSDDDRVHGQIAAGIGLGRLSTTETDEFLDPFNNVQTTETKTSGTLIGLHAALAGDYFLHPHFALGIEGGVQGTFVRDVKEEGRGRRVSVGANGAYGALRAMVVF